MSASKFFRNFLSLPQMGMKENSCHLPRETWHHNGDTKVEKTQGSAFPTPESKCKAETDNPLIIANGCHQHQEKVSHVASTRDACPNSNDDHGMQDHYLNPFGLVGKITTKDIEISFCGTEEQGSVQVSTAARGKEVKNESSSEYEHKSSANTEHKTTDVVYPVEFRSLQVLAYGSLKGCKTEREFEEVTASIGVFDELFQNYINNLNATAKTNDLKDSHKATSVTREKGENVDGVPLVNVSFPDATEKLISYRDNISAEQAQNFKRVQRRSTALQKADSPDRSGVHSIMANGCDIQRKNANSGSNGLKPVVRNDEGSTSEATAGYRNFSMTQSNSRGNSKDVKFSCLSIPPCATKDQEYLKKEPRYLTDIVNYVVEAEYFSQPTEIVSQHNRTCENVKTSTFDAERGDVEPSTRSPSEKIMDALHKTRHEAEEASDDECSSIASSNTEIYEEANCEDIEICKEGTQEEVFKIGVNDLPASGDVSILFPKETKLNKKKTEGRIAPKHALSSNNYTTLVGLLQDNSRHVQINTSPFSLTNNHFQAEHGHSRNSFERSYDNLCNRSVPKGKVSIVMESQILNATKTKFTQSEATKKNSNQSEAAKTKSTQSEATKTKSNQSEAAKAKSNHSEVGRHTLKSMSRKRISVASGIVYEDEVSSFETSKSSTMTETLLSSDHSNVSNCKAYNKKNAVFIHNILTPFHCNICNKSFKTRDDFMNHCKVHKEEELRDSVVCKKVFTHASTAKQHVMTHLDQKLFSNVEEKVVSCLELSQSSTMSQTLRSSDHSDEAEIVSSFDCQSNNDNCASSAFHNHKESIITSKLLADSVFVTNRGLVRLKDKEKPFACLFCGKAYKNRSEVYMHIRLQHDEKRYFWEFCGKRFALEGDLSKHVTMHTQEKRFTCDQCGKRFRLQSNLRSHKYKHSEERIFPCNKCSKSFKTSGSLSVHRASHKREDQGKGIICSICKYVFSNRHVLKQHMMIHTGEKPFSCTLCDKRFRLKVQLRYHVNTHNGKKKHADKLCSLCGKSVTANYMPIHMRMHSGEKPFECSVCFKRFPKKINLEGHIRSHTGEKPFACSGCDKRFALYSNMMTHKARCITISENVA